MPMLEGLRHDIELMESAVQANPQLCLENGGRYMLAGALVAPFAVVSTSGLTSQLGGGVLGTGMFVYGFLKLRSRVRTWSRN